MEPGSIKASWYHVIFWWNHLIPLSHVSWKQRQRTERFRLWRTTPTDWRRFYSSEAGVPDLSQSRHLNPTLYLCEGLWLLNLLRYNKLGKARWRGTNTFALRLRYEHIIWRFIRGRAKRPGAGRQCILALADIRTRPCKRPSDEWNCHLEGHENTPTIWRTTWTSVDRMVALPNKN